jgi:hypothetical protein
MLIGGTRALCACMKEGPYVILQVQSDFNMMLKDGITT